MWLLLLRRRRCKACPRLVIWPLYLTATCWQTVAAMPTRLYMAASLTIAMHAASSMSPSDPTNNALAYAFEITAPLFFSQCHNHGTPFLQLVSQMASSRLLSNMAVSALAAAIMPSWGHRSSSTCSKYRSCHRPRSLEDAWHISFPGALQRLWRWAWLCGAATWARLERPPLLLTASRSSRCIITPYSSCHRLHGCCHAL